MTTLATNEKFNVVILYDKLDASRRAMAHYTQLTQDLAWECLPALNILRCNAAASMDLVLEADRDIASADLILGASCSRLSGWSIPCYDPKLANQIAIAQRSVLVV